MRWKSRNPSNYQMVRKPGFPWEYDPHTTSHKLGSHEILACRPGTRTETIHSTPSLSEEACCRTLKWTAGKQCVGRWATGEWVCSNTLGTNKNYKEYFQFAQRENVSLRLYKIDDISFIHGKLVDYRRKRTDRHRILFALMQCAVSVWDSVRSRHLREFTWRGGIPYVRRRNLFQRIFRTQLPCSVRWDGKYSNGCTQYKWGVAILWGISFLVGIL